MENVTDYDMDLLPPETEEREPRYCSDCEELEECCCDYNICMRRLKKLVSSELCAGGKRTCFDWELVTEIVAKNVRECLRDVQGDTCEYGG
jgi:hypothetical protein